MSKSMDGQVCLITGANKGIGLAAARQLGKLGIKVLVGSRDPKRGTEAVAALAREKIVARCVAIEVTDQDSIAAAVADVEKNEGRLDILVNNAGTGLDNVLPSNLEMAALRNTLETNFFGAFATTKAFLPLLRRSDSGRIVNVSSALGSLFHTSDPDWIGFSHVFAGYSISKVALNALTVLLSAELHGSTLKVNSVEPGYTNTELTANRGTQTPEEAARVIVKYATIGADGPNGGYFDIHGRMPW